MKQLIYIAITFLLLNCKAPDYLPKQPKIGEVEYFDFEDFEKNKSKKYKNEYFLKRKDTIEILKAIEIDYIFETFTVFPRNYKLIKEYYPNGVIKERGKEYYYGRSDNFKIGIWEYFDERGHLIRTEDKDGKDRDYKMTYKEAFRRVCWHFGFSTKDVEIRIEIGNNEFFWVFTKGEKSKAVEMKTGKVSRASILYKM
ncbi:hypothetical protein [Capnocytophaga sputigena]|uniref:hypothetical protein n=1 Tax=Capnocytophaga sputigena TaxID=1019 RepID=UPI00241E4EC8